MVVRAYRSLEQLTVATIDASIRFKLYVYLAKITEHDNCLHEWSTFTEGRIFTDMKITLTVVVKGIEEFPRNMMKISRNALTCISRLARFLKWTTSVPCNCLVCPNKPITYLVIVKFVQAFSQRRIASPVSPKMY